jgi:hypothetical protein
MDITLEHIERYNEFMEQTVETMAKNPSTRFICFDDAEERIFCESLVPPVFWFQEGFNVNTRADIEALSPEMLVPWSESTHYYLVGQRLGGGPCWVDFMFGHPVVARYQNDALNADPMAYRSGGRVRSREEMLSDADDIAEALRDWEAKDLSAFEPTGAAFVAKWKALTTELNAKLRWGMVDMEKVNADPEL